MPRCPSSATAYLEQLAREIRDHNYRLFAEGDKIHAVTAGRHLGRAPIRFCCSSNWPRRPQDRSMPNHAFYLGYEMAKAVTALTLGKDYRQDEALDWGFLTVPRTSHRLTRGEQTPRRAAERAEPRTTAMIAMSDASTAARDRRGCRWSCRWRTALDAEQAFLRLAGRPHALFLDSARRDPELGRYSFLAADPFDLFRRAGRRHRRAWRSWPIGWRAWQRRRVPGLPPFQGGAAGLWAYDLNRSLERDRRGRRSTNFSVPALAVGLVRRGAGVRSSVGRRPGSSRRVSRARAGGPPAAGRERGRRVSRVARPSRPPSSLPIDAAPRASPPIDLAPQFRRRPGRRV